MKTLSMLAAICCLWICFSSVGVVASVGEPTTALAQERVEDPGMKVFTEQCSLCHGVASAEIKPKTEDEEGQGPDLGGLAEKTDSQSIMAFVNQEGALDGKRHRHEFKGSDEELQVLVDWLLKQKAEG